MTIHAMIDLETLSTKLDTVILTLGAVKFDPYSKAEPSEPLYLPELTLPTKFCSMTQSQ
jgi:hypothetical protein